MRPTPPDVAAVILAGGRATRMGGGDKALRPFAGATLLEAVLGRIAPQVRAVAISANGDPARFSQFGLPVLPDEVPGQPGPLAGLLAGMRWAAARAWLLSVPADAPFLPADLAVRLLSAASRGGAIASSAGRVHPVVGLWPVAMAPRIAAALAGGERRVGAVAAMLGARGVAFPMGAVDPFLNVNTPEDLSHAERIVRENESAV